MVLVLFLVACTAFFVAAEYAVIRSRMSRIEQWVAEGNKKAVAVKQIVSRLDEYLSACQLGNTLTNLALGWLGESTVEHLLSPAFALIGLPDSVEKVLSFAIAFLVLTFLEVVIGELVPKILAIQKAEALALALAKPLMIFFRITYPFSWVLNRSARLVTGMFGLKPISDQENNRTEAELRLILSEGYKSGIINSSEFRYVTNIFELDDMVAKGIMIPRKEVAFIGQEETIRDAVSRTSHAPYDRYPVTAEEDKDHVVGMIAYKALLTAYIREPESHSESVARFVQPVLQVIDTITVQELLLLMQKKEIHLAVLVDEFGGTSGILSIKDIIGRIVGERKQSVDDEGRPLVEKLDSGRYRLSGTLLIEEVNRLLKSDIEQDEGVYTLGGWLMSELHEVGPNARVTHAPYVFVLTELEDSQINRVEAMRITEGNESAP